MEKEEFREKMINFGRDVAIHFATFCAENYEISGGTFRQKGTKNYDKIEEIFKIWSDEK